MRPEVVAVLDVGKTNKKISVYDRRFQVLGEERTTLETKERDGLEIESTPELMGWFTDALRRLTGQFDVRSIAITTHGATCALLDGSGALAYPVISYTSAKGAEVQEEFYRTFGDRKSLHRTTCSPDLGFANIGKVLYYVKTRLLEVWASCRHALFYTSYLGYELTGNMGMEPTYLGNHNCLWNFREYTWSSVAQALGADRMFPGKLSKPWDLLGAMRPGMAHACGLREDCAVTMGIHDSNANFLPYLAQGHKDFILNSTGTWCVVMRQAPNPELTDEEITAKVFYNLDAFGKPLKTSIFPAGLEYDTFRQFTDARDADDREAAQDVIAKRELFVVPGVLPDAAPFPGATPRVVDRGRSYLLRDLEKDQGKPMAELGQAYYAALNLSLAFATRDCLRRCGAQRGTKVFIEGGFAKNKIYCELLAALCPDCTIALTSLKEGTSFGAALTGWMCAEGLSLDAIGREFSIETSEVPRQYFGDLQAYEDTFQALLKE